MPWLRLHRNTTGRSPHTIFLFSATPLQVIVCLNVKLRDSLENLQFLGKQKPIIYLSNLKIGRCTLALYSSREKCFPSAQIAAMIAPLVWQSTWVALSRRQLIGEDKRLGTAQRVSIHIQLLCLIRRVWFVERNTRLYPANRCGLLNQQLAHRRVLWTCVEQVMFPSADSCASLVQLLPQFHCIGTAFWRRKMCVSVAAPRGHQIPWL